MQHKPKRSRAIALPSGEFRARATEYLDFLAAWVQKPRQTASVVPSSRYLARLMVAQIDPTDGRVLRKLNADGQSRRSGWQRDRPRSVAIVDANWLREA